MFIKIQKCKLSFVFLVRHRSKYILGLVILNKRATVDSGVLGSATVAYSKEF